MPNQDLYHFQAFLIWWHSPFNEAMLHSDWAMLHPDWAMPHPKWAMPHPDWAMPHPNWAMLHPNWAMPHPIWATPHPYWALPHPSWAMPHPDINIAQIYRCSLSRLYPHLDMQLYWNRYTGKLYIYIEYLDNAYIHCTSPFRRWLNTRRQAAGYTEIRVRAREIMKREKERINWEHGKICR